MYGHISGTNTVNSILNNMLLTPCQAEPSLAICPKLVQVTAAARPHTTEMHLGFAALPCKKEPAGSWWVAVVMSVAAFNLHCWAQGSCPSTT